MTIRRDARTTLGLTALVLAVVGICLTVYLAVAQNSTRRADQRSQAIAAKKISPPLCHMVWAYQHPDPGTHYPPAIVASWSQIGAEFLGCPFGTKP